VSCSEVRSLLTLRSLDLLEEGERAGVESHLAGCATCRLEVEARDDVAAQVRAKPAFEKPPERVWDALVAKIDAGAAPAVATARRPVLDLACAACSGSVESAVYCSSCLAPHHAECFAKCAVRGCRSTTIVSAKPAPVRTRGVPLVLVGVAAIVMVGFMLQEFDARTETYRSLVEQAERNQQLEKDLNKFLVKSQPAPTAPRDEIDVACEDEDLATVLDEIGKKAGQNLVVRDVKEKVSLKLHGVRWHDAVNVLATLAKCDIQEVGNVIVLYRPEKRLPDVVIAPVATANQVEAIKPHEPDGVRFPDGRTIFVTLEGVVVFDVKHSPQSSRAIISKVSYREGDVLRGLDGNVLVPAVYVTKIQQGKVELASGALDGPRVTIEMGR